MQACDAYIACINANRIQYTLRQVPPELDVALRETAQREHESINRTALVALARGLGVSDRPSSYDDLDALVGTWEEDPAFNAVIAEHDQVDPEQWS